jgi:transcriptional regulator with XRE-family HTH domain
MVATTYTGLPLASAGMANELHKTEPQRVLAENLSAALERRGYSARSVAKAIGVSNKTVSNMLNAEGAPQLDKLITVAMYIRVPLWQLLCPAIDISQFKDDALHELIEAFVHLSEVGQASVRRTIKAEAALAKTEPNVPKAS